MDVDQVQVRLQQISDLTPELMGAIQTGAIETEDIFEGILMSFQTEPTEGSEERPDFTMTEPVQDIGLNFRGGDEDWKVEILAECLSILKSFQKRLKKLQSVCGTGTWAAAKAC
mmetsp:Transcript_32883/g.51295  ORF Transcript_32883/g.51295 Transcript_32883/m.51295 type:complete len:114 (-) Transcript_32883:324-665(-)